MSLPFNLAHHFRRSTTLAALLFATSATFAQTGKDGAIEKCTNNLGTLAIAEPQSQMLYELTRYKLGSPSTMLRMIAQESGCFTVVERGVALQNMQQERALASGGQLQGGSNIGGGQMQAADFVLTPTVQFSGDTGGVAGAVGSLLGRFGAIGAAIGGIAGGVSFKEAETTILVADVRSGIQVASAEGQASKMNFSLGGWGWGGMGWASAGGYSKTPEGKLIAASLLDNYNKIVQQVRNKPSLIQSTSASSQNNANNSIRATQSGAAPAAAAPAYVAPSVAPANVPAYVAPQAAGSIPAEFIGSFSCQLAGGAQGLLSMEVGRNGALFGMGTIVQQGTSAIQGNVSSTGQVMVANMAGMGVGQIDAAGKVAGTWTGADGSKGTFSCNRR